jgi:transposase
MAVEREPEAPAPTYQTQHETTKEAYGEDKKLGGGDGYTSPSSDDVEVGIVNKTDPLARDLKSRHMQMIAIGMCRSHARLRELPILTTRPGSRWCHRSRPLRCYGLSPRLWRAGVPGYWLYDCRRRSPLHNAGPGRAGRALSRQWRILHIRRSLCGPFLVSLHCPRCHSEVSEARCC